MFFKNSSLRTLTAFFAVALLASSCFMNSCKKDTKDEPEVTSQIVFPVPGMGEDEGELQGTAFTLPENIEVQGEIMGSNLSFFVYKNGLKQDYSNLMINERLLTKRTTLNNDTIFRGSGLYVNILIKLKNTGSASKRFEFPAGLTFKNVGGLHQSGILVKKVEVEIDGGSSVASVLTVYCVNASLEVSSEEAIYEIGPIVNIPQFTKLFELVKDKKINVEEYDWDFASGSNIYMDYVGYVMIVQDAVWSITDMDGQLTQEDIGALQGLPESGK